jgi:F-type H+-transporting ATPase subunit delta
MAELTTLARPYARAAFEAAQQQKEGGLARWSDMLKAAASVAQDTAMQSVLKSPDHDEQFKAGLFLDICGERLNQTGSNFVKLLAENHRLDILPEILQVFEELRAEAERTIVAKVISAYEVTPEQQERIVKALGTRLDREVILDIWLDNSLIGGAIIQAGDLVIDGSVRGKMTQLATTLRP